MYSSRPWWRLRLRCRKPNRRVRRYTSAAAATVLILGLSMTPAAAAAPAPAPSSPPAPADPIEVHPAWGGLPGQSKILNLLNVTSEVGLACCIAAIVIGGAAMGLGRLSGSMQSGSRGSGMVLSGGGGAILIILAPRLVQWLIQ